MPGSNYWDSTPPPAGVTINAAHPLAPNVFIDARQGIAQERVYGRTALHTNATSNASYKGTSPFGPVLSAGALDSYADNWPVVFNGWYPQISIWFWARFDAATWTDFKNVLAIAPDNTAPISNTPLLLIAYNNQQAISQVGKPISNQAVNVTTNYFTYLLDSRWHHYAFTYSVAGCCTYRDGVLLAKEAGLTEPVGPPFPTATPMQMWLLMGQAGAMANCGVAPRAFTPAEITSLYSSPYQMFNPPVWRKSFSPLPVTQVGVPTSDVSTGGWTTTPLYSKISELTANDSTLITSSSNPASDTCEVHITSLGDPAVSTGHVFSYRYQKPGDIKKRIDLVVSLIQGTTVIASWTHTDIGTALVQQDQTLTGTQADNITDYTDLRFRFVANAP